MAGTQDTPALRGDADVAAVAALLADGARSRMLLALNDGRALPASVLAAEAGVHASTASSHLSKLVGAGLLSVERNGRYRYFKLANPDVGELLEVLTRLAPPRPVRSLRDDTRAHQLREARTCYDHLAGRLGVAVMAALIARGHLVSDEARADGSRVGLDRRSGFGHDLDYELTDTGRAFLNELGVELPPRRRAVRYCIDWSEQRHHLAGGAGRGLLDRFLASGWITRLPRGRAVVVTNTGKDALRRHLAIDW